MTEDYQRPDPDTLLARLQAEEQKRTHGRLKIFMGYAAGVGKTFAMLEAAHQRLDEGVDVLVGLVETHGRAETEALLNGLPVLPLKIIEYRGTHLSELDVDGVLARNPQLVIIDELAHTNAPGARHPKRYMDVEEILERGIDVYTTLNIQHLESQNDIIHQITGISVQETIPDRIVEAADEIELVDLPPNELIQRLKEGKVYIPEQAERAAHQFFRKGNLTALREISLRRAAAQVDGQMLEYMGTKSIPGPWPANERIMVAVSSHPLSERLVRTARRLADFLNADWYAVYIETPNRLRYSPAHAERVRRTLRLAEELGGKVQTITGRTVPEAVLTFAHKHNITKIVAGKPLRSRWQEFLTGSIVDEIIRQSGPIDVYVVSDQRGPVPAPQGDFSRPHRPLRRYLYSVLLVGVGTLISYPIQPLIHPVNLVMVYLAIVLLVALYLGRGPSILASFLSVLAFDFFFINPRFTFTVSDTQYILTFISLLVVGLIISNLTATVRDQVEALQNRQAQTSTLYSLSRELTMANGLHSILEIILTHMGETFGREAAILLPDKGGLSVSASSPGFVLDDAEMAVALWAHQHGHPAGRGTDTLPAARIRYIPLKTTHGVVGVLGVSPVEPDHPRTTDERQFLEAYANLAALAIERVQLDEQASQAKVLQATEKLQSALLNTVSHDLHTPLASITGALESLAEADSDDPTEVVLDRPARKDLEENALEQAQRLNRLVDNLLEMTRLEAGAAKLNQVECDLQELVGTALAAAGNRTRGHEINVNLPGNLPPVYADYVMTEQVLVNLLDNAAKYSLPGKAIDLSARHVAGAVQVSVRDRGAGIPDEDLTKIFDKFYRVQRPDRNEGTGLGLSICRGIIEAQGGKIWAENHPEGGAQIFFRLPVVQNWEETGNEG